MSRWRNFNFSNFNFSGNGSGDSDDYMRTGAQCIFWQHSRWVHPNLRINLGCFWEEENAICSRIDLWYGGDVSFTIYCGYQEKHDPWGPSVTFTRIDHKARPCSQTCFCRSAEYAADRENHKNWNLNLPFEQHQVNSWIVGLQTTSENLLETIQFIPTLLQDHKMPLYQCTIAISLLSGWPEFLWCQCLS